MKFIIFIMCILITSTNCYAYNNFRCLVKDSVTLELNGKLSHETVVAKYSLGKEFVVNRQTGQITGSGFINTMSGQMPTVYNYLPSENGFQAITIFWSMY